MSWRVLVASLMGAVLTVLLIWLLLALGVGAGQARITVPIEQLQAHQGRARVADGELLIEETGPDHLAVVGVGLTGLPAARFDRLGWRLSGLTEQDDLAVVWLSAVDPGRQHAVALTRARLESGELRVADHPGWRGPIRFVGLMIRTDLHEPIRIQALTIEPSAVQFGAVIERLRQDWSGNQPWTMGSINFRDRPGNHWIDSLVLQVAAWLLLSAGLFAALAWRLGWRRLLTGLALLFLIGWLALDLQWQWQLMARLDETRRDYAQAPSQERPRAKEPDASLATVADQIRASVPDDARILLITGNQGDFLPLRTRYHLLPLNVHPGLSRLPDAKQLRAGDFVLMIRPPADIHYRPAEQQLVQHSTTLPAERLFEVRGGISLYRILEQ